MLTIGIRFLRDMCVSAKDGPRRKLPEWPPSLSRTVKAMTAALHRGGNEDTCRDALKWLLRQGYPHIFFSPASDFGAVEGSPVTYFVPINESKTPTKPHTRTPHHFPSVIPHHNTMYFVWPDAYSTEHREGLERLCEWMTSIGHSTSLVHMWVDDEVPEHKMLRHLVPYDIPPRNAEWISCPDEGFLETLEECYQASERPDGEGTPVSYGPPAEEIQDTLSSSFFCAMILQMDPSDRSLDLESTLLATKAIRKALMSLCPVDPIPGWLCGHAPDGSRLKADHMSIVPFPVVGHEHAGGHIRGFAVLLPIDVGMDEMVKCFPISDTQSIHVYDGSALDFRLSRSPSRLVSLQEETWTRSSRVWRTVTPLVLERHPRKSEDWWKEIARCVGISCHYAGLPQPTKVRVQKAPLLEGVPSTFPLWNRRRGIQYHAELTFADPIQGPIVLGAGRYQGYGLCRPMR